MSLLASLTQNMTLGFGADDATNLLYLAAAVLFIYGLKLLSNVKTAPTGNKVSALGMLLATVVTLFLVNHDANGGNYLISFAWIGGALLIGAVIGLVLALKVQMTGMPQMVALLNGFGGIASLLVACADYANKYDAIGAETWDTLLATGLATFVGGITFTGSLIAFAKLQGLKFIPDKPVQFAGQKAMIVLLLLLCLSILYRSQE